jgi:hypothetical protein
MSNTYYALIEKKPIVINGTISPHISKLHENRFHIYSENDRIPINEDELMYVPLNANLVSIMVTKQDITRHPAANISYDIANSKWNESYIETPPVDHNEEIIRIKNELIAETQIKLRVPDLSANANTALTSYLNALNSLQMPNSSDPVVWPTKPY